MAEKRGPKLRYDTVMKPHRVVLPDHLKAYAKEIGGGNFSEGVRRALEFYAATSTMARRS